ncbi:Zinc-type alcohol dehydrogenase-like protein -like protein [Hapsidospora chrysogenum ATCC 11550]|uniref:Zinc-type alcohol dehydrogenase-like protein-like protein n=1 Tax=Hapsidospora chrysogenum (strain ATCC 11550 / CBS 779.69 / DSM 880 / IAM 14645 / JCM 23072 / IMI 49137) TaxID=857340 RepID=A0A086SVU6_HAPC1|nr:Zinc-type alcohol dehydrogenase-like protein -like protein [Hapsidospora chrysogenum ATCC 11550]
MAPGTARSLTISSQSEGLSGLVFRDTEIPQNLKDHEVLVELRAASLNYRDIVLATGNMPHTSLKTRPDVILGSDGAGIVLKVGSSVTSLQPGDKVITHMTPSEYPASTGLGRLDGEALPAMAHISAGLGQELDGTFTTHGVFQESCLIKFDGHLSFEEAATLTCSGLTAWNGLMGLRGREVRKGDWVLVQGSGGVSVAALQFAVAAGATVVATTSSKDKAERLRQLGASHIINYRDVPEWGVAAKELTPSKRGFDIIVDVGGDSTLGEALKCIRRDGLIVLAGVRGEGQPVPLLSIIFSEIAVARGIILGSKDMFRDMLAFVEEHKIKLALDTERFSLEEAKGALERLEQQKHFSKVVVQIPGK